MGAQAQCRPVQLSTDVFRFACDVAIGDLKFGPSYAYVSADRIFDWATQLGSDLPARLRSMAPAICPKPWPNGRARASAPRPMMRWP